MPFDLPASQARDNILDFKTLGSLNVNHLKWVGIRSSSSKLAKVLSHPGTPEVCVYSHTVDGRNHPGLATSRQYCPGKLEDFISQLGPQTDVATCSSLLRRCTIDRALFQGELVHNLIIRRGYMDDTFLNNLLIQMYGKCGSLQHAHAVFDNMSYRNLYSWTIMLAACAQNGHSEEALQLFEQMQAEDLEPDKITSICILHACANVEALEEGQEVHTSVIGNGWESDVVVGTALITMYGKCRSLDDARAVFREMTIGDVVLWNAMISMCAQNGHGNDAFQLYGQMQAEGFEPDKITSICVLDACACEKALELGRDIHASITSNGWESDVIVGNALVNMLGKCGILDDACAVFAEMPQRNVVSWSAMITACVENGHGKEAIRLFQQMQNEEFEPNKITSICVLEACSSITSSKYGREIHAIVVSNGWESDVVVGTSLVNMYGKCGSLEDARAVFSEMPQRNRVSWSSMITACAQNGHGNEALQFFGRMQPEGFEPDEITFICILDACASMVALEEGQEIHASIVGNGRDSDVVVGNALISMYGECGSLDNARAIFAKMQQRNVVSWNAIIAVCAQNGCGQEALQLFDQMQAAGFEPDKITFISVLTACSHMGLVADARQHFTSMTQVHGISPSVEHYECMIDLLGRAGQLDKAEHLINNLPCGSDASAWLNLLSSCRIHGDVERGVRAANFVFSVDAKNGSPYVLLANTFLQQVVEMMHIS